MIADLAFTEPVTGEHCQLVIPPDGRISPFRDQPKIGISHPQCPVLADLVLALDAFYCPGCQMNGRVSGQWCVDQIKLARGIS